MTHKVAINGLGRFGRAALKLTLEGPELELVAVTKIGSLENITYLLKYDAVYGRTSDRSRSSTASWLLAGDRSSTPD